MRFAIREHGEERWQGLSCALLLLLPQREGRARGQLQCQFWHYFKVRGIIVLVLSVLLESFMHSRLSLQALSS